MCSFRVFYWIIYYGKRCHFLHFPLIFLVGTVLFFHRNYLSLCSFYFVILSSEGKSAWLKILRTELRRQVEIIKICEFYRSEEYSFHVQTWGPVILSAQTSMSFSTLATLDWARKLETSSVVSYNLQLSWLVIPWRTLSDLHIAHSLCFYQLSHNFLNLSFQNV